MHQSGAAHPEACSRRGIARAGRPAMETQITAAVAPENGNILGEFFVNKKSSSITVLMFSLRGRLLIRVHFVSVDDAGYFLAFPELLHAGYRVQRRHARPEGIQGRVSRHIPRLTSAACPLRF